MKLFTKTTTSRLESEQDFLYSCIDMSHVFIFIKKVKYEMIAKILLFIRYETQNYCQLLFLTKIWNSSVNNYDIIFLCRCIIDYYYFYKKLF